MSDPQVYVVDDDADVRKGLVLLLESAGYPVQDFDGAEAFLDAFGGLAAGLAGCLVLDVRMPGLDGLGLQRRIVDAGGVIPIIFLTGHGELPDAVVAMRAGAVDFLLKPVDGKLLLQRVAACWESEQARCKARQLREALSNTLHNLTAREREILGLALKGIRNGAIAASLGLSLRTVEAHRSRLLLKLDAASIHDWQRQCEQDGLNSARLIELLAP